MLLAVALLLLCAFLPQSPVDENILISAEQMLRETSDPFFADHSMASTMDLTSEAIMLMESKGLSGDQLENVLENNRYRYEGVSDMRENLLRYAQGETPDKVSPYSRYWMGFRVTLRLLLQKLDYFHIRRFMAMAFFTAFAAAVASVAKNCGIVPALFLGTGIAFVNPHVIAVSLQYFTCFFIAFVAMLLVPWVDRHEKWEGLFFMEIGILTMYFDFYTTPVLTFGLPMVYLCLLKERRGESGLWKRVVGYALLWLAGYVCMWLAKLLLSTLFTEENGLAAGISSFLWRLRLSPGAESAEGFGPLAALRAVWYSLTLDKPGRHFFWYFVFGVTALFAVLFFKGKKPFRTLFAYPELLVLGALPFVWFCVASQPTVYHMTFQYRGIALSFWALTAYLYVCACGDRFREGG